MKNKREISCQNRIERSDILRINGVVYHYYENPYQKILELQEIVLAQEKQIKALESSEKFYKNKTIELAEKLKMML